MALELGYVSVRRMLAEVSALELSQWQAHARYRAEQSDAAAKPRGGQSPDEVREARRQVLDEAEDAPQPVATGEVARSPGEPPPDIGIGGVEIPPAALWGTPPEQ